MLDDYKLLASTIRGDVSSIRYRTGALTHDHISWICSTCVSCARVSHFYSLTGMSTSTRTNSYAESCGICRINPHKYFQGIATSLCNTYLFAAGQDRHIRAWSLHTGRPIVSPNQSPPPADPDLVNLSQALPEPIVALQVTEGGGGGGASPDGMSLWAASGKQIFRYWLGQRLDPIAMRY